MNPTISTIGVAAFRDDKVLLVRSGDSSGHITGTYGLPSGRVDEGEKEIDAAAREFEEETGLVVNINDLSEFKNNTFTADIPRKDGTIKRMFWRVYRARNYSGKLKATDETVPEWVLIEQLDSYNLLPNVKNTIMNCLKDLNNG